MFRLTCVALFACLGACATSGATQLDQSVPDTTMDPATPPPQPTVNGSTESNALAIQRFGGSLRGALTNLAEAILATGTFANEQIQGGDALGLFFIHVRRFALVELGTSQLQYTIEHQRALPSGELEARFILIGPQGQRRGILVRTNREVTEINFADPIF